MRKDMCTNLHIYNIDKNIDIDIDIDIDVDIDRVIPHDPHEALLLYSQHNLLHAAFLMSIYI